MKGVCYNSIWRLSVIGRGSLSDIGTITTIDTGAAEQILKMWSNISWIRWPWILFRVLLFLWCLQTESDDGDVMTNPIPGDTTAGWQDMDDWAKTRPEWCGHLPCLMQSRLFIGVFMAHFVNTSQATQYTGQIYSWIKIHRFENITAETRSVMGTCRQ